ncbi:Plasmodium exported protein, unknown function [Plasmodium malariae]|uniref:Fam-m protein n=1 Tax=Plasmodium malariae TaxID=5858 RepID=A0A1D3JHS2_PLAMA|nr:Plasmodium exported protein, unknown function [Plasmodium malariae]SBT85961.1 Plasmodium exported protein, unknown function [Plasmodium malariae]
MEYKIKSIYFMKIGFLILLTWIYHFYNEERTIHILYGQKKYDIKLYISNFRILRGCDEINNSNIVEPEQQIHKDEENDGKAISNNRRKNKQTNIQSRRSSLYEEFNKKYKVQKKLIYGKKKLSPFERKFFKQLDYIDFIIKKKPLLRNKAYRKLVCEKFGHKMFLLTLVLSFVLLASLGGTIGCFFNQSKNLYNSNPSNGEVNLITLISEYKISFLVFLSTLIVMLIIYLSFTYMKFRKHKRIVKKKC